jgi:hypothetical protein
MVMRMDRMLSPDEAPDDADAPPPNPLTKGSLQRRFAHELVALS